VVVLAVLVVGVDFDVTVGSSTKSDIVNASSND